MAKRYFTLLSRENAESPWGIEFGAYEYRDVDYERAELRDGGTRAKNLCIITSTDQQADIDAQIIALNAHLLPRMHCDSCEMLSINGVACHETGCPNSGARYDRESGEWIKQRKCFDCGCTVDQSDPC